MFRNKLFIALVAVFACAGVLYAATHTYNVTVDTKGHKRLTKMLEIENTRRAALKPPLAALTEQEFVQMIWDTNFKRSWRRTRRRLRRKMTEADLDASVGVN